MKKNLLLRLLSSIPIILLFLYFIPFIGICLIILRFFIYSNQKVSTSIVLLIIGLFMISPLMIHKTFELLHIKNISIPYLNDLVNSNLYHDKLISYSKLLISVSIIFIILSFVFKSLFTQFRNKIREYIIKNEQKDAEIFQKNDLIMKEKREKSKNTHVVYCPYCGSDNVLTEQSGTCKFCRRKIEYKEIS